MSRFWVIHSPPKGRALDLASVALLLDAPHDAAPARRMLAFVNQLAPVDHICLVEYPEAAPTLIEGHAHAADAPNVTQECFSIYRRHYYRSDQATVIAEHLRHQTGHAPVTALHCRAGDLPVASWRNEIYERRHLADRLSFLYAPLPHTAFAINLYRNESRGAFRDAEIEALLAVCPLLRQVHHSALRHAPPQEMAAPQSQALARAAAQIARKVPQLSPREREVCARIACGISADGIAADLGIAPSTVITLRKRAYAKLADAGMYGGRLQLARWFG